jgi:hypothetical protein
MRANVHSQYGRQHGAPKQLMGRVRRRQLELEQSSKASKAFTARFIPAQREATTFADQLSTDTTKPLLPDGRPYAFSGKNSSGNN